MTKKIILALASISLLALSGCSTTKGYEGKKVDSSSLAQIYSSEFVEVDEGDLALLITDVGEKNVGNFWRGFPGHVKVKPGNVELNVVHKLVTFEEKALFGVRLATAFVIPVAGVAAMDVIGTAAQVEMDKGEAEETLNVFVEEGKTYRIAISSESGSAQDVVWELEEYDPPPEMKPKGPPWKANRRNVAEASVNDQKQELTETGSTSAKNVPAGPPWKTSRR